MLDSYFVFCRLNVLKGAMPRPLPLLLKIDATIFKVTVTNHSHDFTKKQSGTIECF